MAKMKEVLANKVDSATYEAHRNEWELTCATLKFQVTIKDEELKVSLELCDSQKTSCKRAKEECTQAKVTKQKAKFGLLLAKEELAKHGANIEESKGQCQQLATKFQQAHELFNKARIIQEKKRNAWKTTTKYMEEHMVVVREEHNILM
jgi:hypothetical protein